MPEDRENNSISKKLAEIAKSGKIAQAYLLEGSDASELLAASKDFAKRIGASAADTLFVEREKPNLISVADVRNGIVGSVSIRPYDSPYKVYIVEHADEMNVQAENALLKTLEEPPEYVVILLLTGNTKVFLPTILSRCVKISDTESAEDASDRAEEEEAVRLTDEYFEKLPTLTTAGEIHYTEEFAKKKAFAPAIFSRMLQWYREILKVKMSGSMKQLLLAGKQSALRALSERMSYEAINEGINTVLETRERIEANVNTEMSFKVLILAQRKACGVK